MSDKKFEVTYSGEAAKVMRPIGEHIKVSDMQLHFESAEGLLGCSTTHRFAVEVVDKLDDEIRKCIIDVAKEQGCSSVYILDKYAIAERLKRLDPKEIIVHGYRPGRAVNSLSYTCPTCGAHIGRYPFCKYCGQALDLEVELGDEE